MKKEQLLRFEMSSKNSNNQHLFFVDPALDRTYSYAQFESDLRNPQGITNADSPYAVICQLVANLVRHNDFMFENGKVTTASGPVGSELTSHLDWRSSMLASRSTIRLTTSGTTGKPKFVFHTIKSLTRGVRTGRHHENDVWALAYPIGHLSGIQVLFQALCNRNTIVKLFGLPPKASHLAIARYGLTHLSCTPTFLKLLAGRAHSHPTVRRLTTGGESCEKSTTQMVSRLFPNAKHRNIYALTEVGNLLIANGEEFSIPANLQSLVKIMNGSLAIHQSLMANAIKPHESRDENENFQSNHSSHEIDTEWYVTGDLVEVISDAPLTFKFLARDDDIINVGGYKVVPQQVEAKLIAFPAIQQAVVFGKKNSVTGQLVVCNVVVNPGYEFDPVTIRQQLAELLPRYAIPRVFTVVDSLPMTSTGKLSRRDVED